MNDALKRQLIDRSPVVWILNGGFLTENGKPIEFNTHRWLIDYLADDHPYKVSTKCSQVGMTVTEFLDDFHLVGKRGMNVIHTFHTSDILQSVVTPKVNPLIENNPEIKAMQGETDSQGLKRFGNNFLYLRGANSQSQAISISADVLKIDEKDRSDLSVVEMFHSRLDFSDYKWIREFSNPSAQGIGVDATWQRSDMRHWFVKCHWCNHEMYMDFEPNSDRAHYVDPVRRIYACGKCDQEISTADRIKGEWVAKWPSRDRIHGYWFSQMMAPWFSAGDILDKYEDMSIDIFYNFVLGKAYTPSDLKFDRETILAACKPGAVSQRGMVMGSDIGKPHWYWLGNASGVLEVGQAKSWDELERIFTLYQCDAWVMDAQPEFTKVQEMVKKYPGRAFACYYVKDRKNIGVVRWQEGADYGIVHADRTKIIDRVVTETAAGQTRFLQRPQELDTLIDHASHIYRQIVQDDKGNMNVDWLTEGAEMSKKADHLVHAGVYWRIALEQSMGSVPQGRVITDPISTGVLRAPAVSGGKVEFSVDVSKSIERAKRG